MRIYIHDEFPPETSAMLQALYSRSDKSVEQHVQKVQERGADKFMASYYVGYGHASIGDCGVTTLFVEDISILACKAIQDNALYSGQETSTRYIDFAGRRNRCTEWRADRKSTRLNSSHVSRPPASTLFPYPTLFRSSNAIQDNALYSGQETSTRYIDFAGRRNRCTEWR